VDVAPRVEEPRPAPDELALFIASARGATARGEVICAPGKERLAVSLSGASGQAQAWLRFERPPSPTEFDIDVPSRSSLVTEDGAFTAGRWHVLVRNDAGGEGVRFTVACQ
jgi:hypothetical protein